MEEDSLRKFSENCPRDQKTSFQNAYKTPGASRNSSKIFLQKYLLRFLKNPFRVSERNSSKDCSRDLMNFFRMTSSIFLQETLRELFQNCIRLFYSYFFFLL